MSEIEYSKVGCLVPMTVIGLMLMWGLSDETDRMKRHQAYYNSPSIQSTQPATQSTREKSSELEQ